MQFNFFLFNIIVYLLFSCSDNTVDLDSSDKNHIAYVYCEFDSNMVFYYHNENGSFLDTVTSSLVSGNLFTNSENISFNNYIQNGDTIIDNIRIDDYYVNYEFGDTKGFGSADCTDPMNPILDNFDEIDIEINTNFSSIKGSLPKPSDITNFSLVSDDTLNIGEECSLSWNGDSDFYKVTIDVIFPSYFSCPYRLITYIENSNLILDNSFFQDRGLYSFIDEYYGELHNIIKAVIVKIKPINGVIPVENAEFNMNSEGSGNGFLFYGVEEKEYPLNISIYLEEEEVNRVIILKDEIDKSRIERIFKILERGSF